MSLLYFDVGLGAMIVQGIVAATAAIVLFSKGIMYKIKLFFGLVKESDYDAIDIDENDTSVDEK